MLRVQLSQLANWHYSKYKPSTQMLKKHGILKKLRGNKDKVITHPEKGNGVVIMNQTTKDKIHLSESPWKYTNLFRQAVMLVTWVKLPVIYLPGQDKRKSKSCIYANICHQIRTVSIAVLMTAFLFWIMLQLSTN